MTRDDVPKSGRTVNSSKEEVLDIVRRNGSWNGYTLAASGWSEERIGKFFQWLRNHPEFQKELMSARGAHRVKRELCAPKPRKTKRKWRAVVFYGFNTCKG